RPSDGAIDFTGFSTAQLRALEYSIDARAYPLNYRNLQLELQRREGEPAAPDLILRGWRRTWLGVGCKAELSIPFEAIRNVVQEDGAVRLEVQRRFLRRRFEFRLESREHATRLAALLPATRTRAFDREWRELHAFNRALNDNCPHAWATPSLVAANSVVFLAMAVDERRLYGFDLQQLANWGANYGPLTAGGQ